MDKTSWTVFELYGDTILGMEAALKAYSPEGTQEDIDTVLEWYWEAAGNETGAITAAARLGLPDTGRRLCSWLNSLEGEA